MASFVFIQFKEDFLSNILSFGKTPLSLRPLNERFLNTFQIKTYISSIQLFTTHKRLYLLYFPLLYYPSNFNFLFL